MAAGANNNNGDGKLQELIQKWGAKSAGLLLILCCFIYSQDRAQMITDIKASEARVLSDNKALAARVSASERAIGRVQDGKASREELKAVVETITRDNQRTKDDIKETILTLKSDLIQRMDILTVSSNRQNKLSQ